MWYERLDGDAAAVVRHLQALGARWVAVKLADGASWGTPTEPTVFHDQFVDLVGALHAAGIAVLAFVYDYLDDPLGEADKAGAAVALGADGIVLDVEYEAIGKLAAATIFLARLRAQLPAGFPVAFSPDLRILVGNAQAPWSDDQPNLEREPWPWDAFAAHCDALMPQLYFTDFQVRPEVAFGLVDVWRKLAAAKGWSIELAPILPANAGVGDLAAAVALAHQYGAVGFSLWRLDDASAGIGSVLASANG